jgi:hypothetical protein
MPRVNHLRRREHLSCGTRSLALHRGSLIATCAALGMLVGVMPAPAPAAGDEASAVIKRLLAPPQIAPAPGFSVRVVVPPGELYDPLFMTPQGGAVWLNDDGGEQGDNGGRIVSIAPRTGKVSILIGPDSKLLPTVGMDVAPASFGSYGGQVFTLAQPRVGEKGIAANHVIQVIDLKTRTTKILCTLPPSGDINHGIAGGGVAARFGQQGSPFAGRFFAVTALNNAIYQVTADGQCTLFVNFGARGGPIDFTFTPDGASMLVSVNPDGADARPGQRRGTVLRVSPKGEVDPQPVVSGLGTVGGLAFAPKGFDGYGDQLFMTDIGEFELPLPMTQVLKRDGAVYRVAPGGKVELVAAGFVNPLGLRFIGNHLWVTDIAGDFIDGHRELPDGFVVEISASGHH